MKIATLLLCSAAVTLGACHSSNDMYNNSGPRYTPRPYIAEQDYTNADHVDDHMDKKYYNQYEHREPCQKYRKVPRHMIDKCEAEMQIVETRHEYVEYEQKALPIVSTYTVLFDHDRSDIRDNEAATLDRAMREIDRFNPTQVTVTGYTDSSGAADYNQNLSREREQAVSQALLARGIPNQTLEHEARGQYDQAVETENGVRNQQNRRVVIDFRR